MSYNSCNIVNYSRINPNTGAGFILMRLFENGPMSKRSVYDGTRYRKWRPGYHSSIWAKMLDDELIAADGSRIQLKEPPSWYGIPREGYTYRARGKGRTPIYHITDKGKHILAEMLTRCNERK